MFCPKCGKELIEDSKFCDNCGAKVGETTKKEEKIEDRDIVLEVKSKFKIGYHSLSYCIFFIFYILIFSIPMMATDSLADMTIFFIIAAGIFVFTLVIWLISMLFVNLQYKKYRYDFYKTKIIYSDSFFNISEKEVKYKYVREIVFTQSFIQRFFNIGNIMIYTNAESGFTNGVLIRSVENVKDVYEKVKETVNN